MKFSILIANYNNGKFFKECYQSIITQEYKDWEVILVDDCSTDNSLEIINSLIKNDVRFKIYTNTQNHGCGYTKKKCLEYSNGMYCAFLDPDDALFPNALKDSVQYLRNSTHIAVYSKLTLCDENLNIQEDFKKVKQIYNEKYFFNLPIQLHHFFSFKKEVYLKTEGIDPTLRSSVDQDMYLKLLEHGNAKYLPIRMYKYRQHTQGISQSSSKEKAKALFAKVIFNSFKRRNITSIKGIKVPSNYDNPQDIFALLDYQTKISYRIKVKIFKFFQNNFNHKYLDK